MITTTDRIFDTLHDTKLKRVTTKETFYLREYVNKEGKSPIMISITGNRQRERIPTEIYVVPEDFVGDKQTIKRTSQENIDKNLILDNIRAKFTEIKTSYRLSNRIITPALLKKEFHSGMPRILFCSFFAIALENDRVNLAKGSYNRHKSVLKKIQEYDVEISFANLDIKWLENYSKHLLKIGNQKTTVASNVASIKKFLNLAHRDGIKLRLSIDDIKVGSTKGNRTSLSPSELEKLGKTYVNQSLNESWQLILGYFLFSCMTGMRISDVQNLQRKEVLEEFISFVNTKTGIDQSLILNDTAKKIIAIEPLLFIKKFADQHINDELKKIARSIGITKKITFHVARHTFATTFLRKGGKVEKLQKLLGHTSISQTMIYSSIVQSEANEEVKLLDGIF